MVISGTLIENFVRNVNARIESGQHITEDSVRYSFFSALGAVTMVPQHDIILELPHPRIPNAKIDTFVLLDDQKFYIEFKYHRKSNSTSPKPQKAGSLFKDFNRLSGLVDSSGSYVVYLTDVEMANYFRKHNSAHKDFWLLEQTHSFRFDHQFLEGTTKTFRSECGGAEGSTVTVLHSSTINAQHELRVFEISGE